jgi:hypothetical protein
VRAAAAGEKAGPIAHRAAEMTETAGARLAERSRALAGELRRDPAEVAGSPMSDAPGEASPPADESGPRAD